MALMYLKPHPQDACGKLPSGSRLGDGRFRNHSRLRYYCRFLRYRRRQHQARLHNETIRRRTHVIEGVASNQCQFRMRAGVEHPYILRLHDTGVFHLIAVSSGGCLKLDHVIPGNVPQTAE